MRKAEIRLLNEAEYRSDNTSNVLFEDGHSFSFGRVELENASLKFGWNSKGINPELKLVESFSFAFIGVDTYVVGYNYSNQTLAFFLNTSTNFKWFDDISNGIAIVTETGVILMNVTNRCTLRNCFFFGDVILDTRVENNKMRIGFLGDDDEVINI